MEKDNAYPQEIIDILNQLAENFLLVDTEDPSELIDIYSLLENLEDKFVKLESDDKLLRAAIGSTRKLMEEIILENVSDKEEALKKLGDNIKSLNDYMIRNEKRVNFHLLPEEEWKKKADSQDDDIDYSSVYKTNEEMALSFGNEESLDTNEENRMKNIDVNDVNKEENETVEGKIESEVENEAEDIVVIEEIESEEEENNSTANVSSNDLEKSSSEEDSGEIDVESENKIIYGEELNLEQLDMDLLQEFILEAKEHFDNATDALFQLEDDYENKESINAIFRAFHTIKSVAGFLELHSLHNISHKFENLLDSVRKGNIPISEDVIDISFDAIDTMRAYVDSLADALKHNKSSFREVDFSTLSQKLEDFLSGKLKKKSESKEKKYSTNKKEDVENDVKESQDNTKNDVNIEDKEEDEVDNSKSEKKVDLKSENDSSLKKEAKDIPKKTRHGNREIYDVIKVNIDKLNRLVDMIGELVIAQSVISQLPEVVQLQSQQLFAQISRIEKISRELQEIGTSLRMVPIKETFRKMKKIVRDLAKEMNKKVMLIISGEETELDKTVVDRISDPLIHLIRNALDHGLEDSPEERRAAGKPEVGKIELKAYHKEGSIFIEISDDGRGINKEKVLQKAIEKGLVSAPSSLGEKEILDLIFLPGFSTAKKVTDISGRGVGMDVVKRNVESLRGVLEVETEEGKGTTFIIKLPLTLAIIDGMVVEVGGERYIIPTLAISKCVSPEAKDVSTITKKGEMLRVQDEHIPILRLAQLFDIKEDTKRKITDALVIVVEADGQKVGLMVDELIGQQQIVIKSLGSIMRGIPGITGAAIMPDGDVGLILDVGGLLKHARLKSQREKMKGGNMEGKMGAFDESRDELELIAGKYLTFEIGDEVYGIEILKVQEIIGLMHITKVPAMPDYVRGVINLRGKVIPVVDLRVKFEMGKVEDTERTCIVVVQVFSQNKEKNEIIGIIVDEVSEVIDLKEEDLEKTPHFSNEVNTDFLLGIGKKEEKIILLLDVDRVLGTISSVVKK